MNSLFIAKADSKKSVFSIARKLGLLAVISTLLCACTSIYEIKNTRVYEPEVVRTGSVNVASRVTGLDSNAVGEVSILSFPVGTISAEGDISASIMKSVNDAIVATGYNSQSGASFNSVDAAYLKAHVEDMAFGNFLFSTWGTIIIHLRLETRDGDILWKTRLRTKVHTVSSYERTANKAMNRLVKDMVNIFSDDEFYQATQRIKRYNEFLQDNTNPAAS